MPFALVVGSAGGIGRETAVLLRDRGFAVAAIDREAFSIPGIETTVLDITCRDNVQQFVQDLTIPVDVLVMSAAVHNTHPAEYLTDSIVDEVLNVNLSSHIKLVRDVLPHMSNGGFILGVSSIAACVGVPMSSLYSASKAGIEGFYESLRTELAYRRIRVSVIHPGNVNTGFNETGNTYKPVGNPVVDKHYADVVNGIDSTLGISPKHVAEVALRVLSRKKPRFCYVVGMNARKANWARKILGRDLAIKLMGKFFGF